jgi:uncharacterized protein (TIGR03437 family)
MGSGRFVGYRGAIYPEGFPRLTPLEFSAAAVSVPVASSTFTGDVAVDVPAALGQGTRQGNAINLTSAAGVSVRVSGTWTGSGEVSIDINAGGKRCQIKQPADSRVINLQQPCNLTAVDYTGPTGGSNAKVQVTVALGNGMLSLAANYLFAQADLLSLVAISPVQGTTLQAGASLQFCADVTVVLAAHDSGTVTLRVQDQSGALLSSSDPTAVKRSDPPPRPRLCARTFTIPTGATRVSMQAALVADGVTALSDTTEYLVTSGSTAQDRVTLGADLVPAVPASGGVLPRAPNTFTVSLQWSLVSAPEADLALLLLDQLDIQVGRSEAVRVSRGNSPGQASRTVTVDFGDTAKNMIEVLTVRLKGVLVNPATQRVVAESPAVSYPIDSGKIHHIELVQKTQTETNSVDLVAREPTLARVFVQYRHPESNPFAISGRLAGIHTLFGAVGAAQEPINARFTPMKAERAAAARRSIGGSLNFLIPLPWLDVYDFKVEARLATPGGQETGEKMSAELSAARLQRNSLAIGFIPVCYQPPGLAKAVCPSMTLPEGIRDYLPRHTGVSLESYGAELVFTKPLREDPAQPGRKAENQRHLLSAIRKQYLNSYQEWHYVFGLSADVRNLKLDNGQDAGVEFYGVSSGANNDPKRKTKSVSWIQNLSGIRDDLYASLAAHELAHTLGLSHAGGQTDCNPAPNPRGWPYPTALVQEPGWLWRLGYSLIPGTAPDLMSYCHDERRWVSPFTWQGIAAGMAPGAGAPIPAMSARNAEARAAGEEVAVISGAVTRSPASATLDPISRRPAEAPADEPDPGGAYCLALTGTASTGRFCFDLDFRIDAQDTPEDRFVLAVPVPAGLRRVGLEFNGREIASRTASQNAPQVTILSPAAGDTWTGAEGTIRWRATDADGDALTYNVLYSADGGSRWSAVAVDQTATEIAANLSLLSPSEDGRIRVTAMDGVHTGAAEAGPIRIRTRPSAAAAPAEVDFGKTIPGQVATAAVTVSNRGSGGLRITAAATDNPRFAATGGAPGFVPAGGSLQIPVEYLSEEARNETATLRISTNDPDRPQISVALRARAVATPLPEMSVTPATLDFGSVAVGRSAERAFTVQNRGLGPLTVASIVSSSPQFAAAASTPVTLDEGAIAVAVRFQPAATGAASGEITVSGNDPDHPALKVRVSGTGIPGGSGPRPVISAGGVTDAAQYKAVVVPGGMASVFGVDLAGATVVASTVPWPRELAGVQARVNSVNAPLYFVSPGMINIQIPFETQAGGTADIVVVRDGVASAAEKVSVASFAPAPFMRGEAPIVVRYPDNTEIGAANPARPGDILIAYLTGLGGLTSAPRTGDATPASPLAQTTVTPTITLGGAAAASLFAGLTPGCIGLAQINLQLPATLPAGASLPLVFRFGNASSPPVQLAVRSGAASGPAIAVPASLDFGNVPVGQNRDVLFTIANTGTATLNVRSAQSSATSFAWMSPPTPFALTAGGRVSGTIRFTPAVAGARAAVLTINSDDPSQPAVSIMATGTGVQ